MKSKKKNPGGVDNSKG